MAPEKIYTPELGALIAHYISLDYTYKQIAHKLSLEWETVASWCVSEEDLIAKFSNARTKQASSIEANLAEVLFDVRTGVMDAAVGRVLAQGMQWRASKKDPRVYGDKTILSNDPDNPVSALAVRLDSAILQHKMVDVTPEPTQICHLPADGSDLV